LPFGPYFAACLAVGDIYLSVRMPRGQYLPASTYGWDCLKATPLATDIVAPSTAVAKMLSDWAACSVKISLSTHALAGVGAVGAAWMHTLWACPGLTGSVPVVDADSHGVTDDNLNRGVLYTRADIGKPKAITAASAAPGDLRWLPSQGRFEEAGVAPDVLVSAVDGNDARAALQGRYPPVILSGSTRDLRAETLRVFPDSGACLRCHNPPRTMLSDDELRVTALSSARLDDLAGVAAALNVETTALAEKLRRWECDEMSERALRRIRELVGGDVAEFSVGFVSVAAGVLLAADTVKQHAGVPVSGTLITGESTAPSSVVFQFWKPHAPVNRAARLGRDDSCPACRIATSQDRVWRQRWRSYLARR